MNAEYAARFGLSFRPGVSAWREGDLDLRLEAAHPLAARFPATVRFTDESYWQLPGDTSGLRIVARARESGADRPQAWTREVGSGRVFACIPGHFDRTHDDPFYRILVLRGIAWSRRTF